MFNLFITFGLRGGNISIIVKTADTTPSFKETLSFESSSSLPHLIARKKWGSHSHEVAEPVYNIRSLQTEKIPDHCSIAQIISSGSAKEKSRTELIWPICLR